MKLKICLFILLLVNVTFALKTCENCMLPDDCEPVRNLLKDKNNTESLIINAVCETGDFIKICCSDFKGEYEHPNLKLLPEKCGNIDVRIGDGSTVTQFEMPWIALISYRTLKGIQFGCVGTLISPFYVLTAAHCVKNKDIFGVRVGEYDIARAMDCVENSTDSSDCTHENLRVALVTYHDDYNEFGDNDIALMRLRRPANFNKRNVNAVCLPVRGDKSKYELSENDKAISVGWGLQSFYQQSNVLQKDLVAIYSNEFCGDLHNRTTSSNNGTRLCVERSDKKSCIGDSGGPLLIKVFLNGKLTYIQYGMQQQAPTKCASSPEVYTYITKYISWILDNLKP